MNSSLLRKSLQKLGPLTQGKHIPILSCVKLQSVGETLFIHASNMEQYMRIMLPYAGSPVSCCVSHRRLMSLPCDGEIALRCESDVLFVSSPSFNAKLSTLPVTEWPEINVIESEGTVIQGGLGNVIRWCGKAAMDSEAPNDAPFLGLYTSGNRIAATDRKRFHLCNTSLSLPQLRIPSECIDIIAPLMDEEFTLLHNDRVIQIQNQDTIFQTRMLGDAYANIDPVVSRVGIGDAWRFDALAMADGINRTKAIWGELPDKRVNIKASDGTITISSINGKDSMDAEIEGSGAGEFEWSGGMLVDLLSGFGGEVTMNLHEAIISIQPINDSEAPPWDEESGELKLSPVALASTYKI